MKKKNILIIVIVLLLIVGFIILIFMNNEKSGKKLEEFLKEIPKTKSVVVYSTIGNSEEVYKYYNIEYKKIKTIDNKDDEKKIIDIASNIETFDGLTNTPLSQYIIVLLDESGNSIMEFSTYPYVVMGLNEGVTLNQIDANNLIEIIEKDKMDTKCLQSFMGAYIMSEKNKTHDISLKEITDRELEYAKIVGTDDGNIFAIIKTKNDIAINEFDKYFKDNYDGYFKTVLLGYYIYVYNGLDDITFENIETCIK